MNHTLLLLNSCDKYSTFLSLLGNIRLKKNIFYLFETSDNFLFIDSYLLKANKIQALTGLSLNTDEFRNFITISFRYI